MPIPSFDWKEKLRGPAQMWADESEHLRMIRETSVLPKSRIKGRWSPCSSSCHELPILSCQTWNSSCLSLKRWTESSCQKILSLSCISTIFFPSRTQKKPPKLDNSLSQGPSVCLAGDKMLDTQPEDWSP